MVCEMEGISIHPFIVSIKSVLNEFDDKIKKKQCDNQLSLLLKEEKQ